jgi:putative membrane protein (TIGR04086 family)
VLFSLMMFLLRLPVSHSGVFSLLAFAIGCFAAGFFAGMLRRQGGLACGIKAALLFTAPVAVIGFIINSLIEPEELANVTVFAKVIVAVLCGAVGGVVGVNKNSGF